MSLVTELVRLVLLSAAVAAVSMTITKSKVFEPFRSAVQTRSPFLGDLVSCPYCFSHWGSLLAVLLFQPRPLLSSFWLLDYLVAIFAMVTFAALWVKIVYSAYSGKAPRHGTAFIVASRTLYSVQQYVVCAETPDEARELIAARYGNQVQFIRVLLALSIVNPVPGEIVPLSAHERKGG